MNYFFVLNCMGKSLSYFREKLQNYPHIKTFHWFSLDSTYLDPFHTPWHIHTHLFPNTPLFKDKRVLSFCAKTAVQILLNMHKFLLYNKKYTSKSTTVFEREMQAHEMVKFVFKSIVVLILQICFTQSPTMIFNQW